MTYVEKIVLRLEEELPGNDRELTRFYALLVLTTGTATSLEDVHDAWSLWRVVTRPQHKSLIPFEDLSPEVQDLDREYRDAIRRVAAESFI